MNLFSKKKIVIWVILFLLVDIAIITMIFLRDDPTDSIVRFSNLENFLNGKFKSSLLEKGLIIKSEPENDNLGFRYSRGYGSKWTENIIGATLSQAGLDSDFDWNVKSGFNIKLSHPKDGSRMLIFREDDSINEGLISIIIDDFGYYWDERVDDLMSFEAPIAFAVIPGHSSQYCVVYFAR